MDPLSQMPESFAAGTTVKLLRELSDYPADDGWTYALHLRGVGTLDAVGSASGSAFAVTLAAADTDGLAAGTYRWTERVAKAGEKYDAATGLVVVTLDMAAAAAGAGQSHAERVLALIEAAIEGRIPNGMESYQIQGRSVSKIPLMDLERLRGIYAARVARQKNGGQIGSIQMVFRGA